MSENKNRESLATSSLRSRDHAKSDRELGVAFALSRKSPSVHVRDEVH